MPFQETFWILMPSTIKTNRAQRHRDHHLTNPRSSTMRISSLAVLALLLPAAYGRLGNNVTMSDRVLGEDKRVRRGPSLELGAGPKFREGEIVIRGSPSDLPSGVTVKKYLKRSNLTVVKVSRGHERDIVKKLRKKGKVAEENFYMYASRYIPNDPYLNPYQWHFEAIQAPEAWDLTSGENVVVAVLDTGEFPSSSYMACGGQ